MVLASDRRYKKPGKVPRPEHLGKRKPVRRDAEGNVVVPFDSARRGVSTLKATTRRTIVSRQ